MPKTAPVPECSQKMVRFWRIGRTVEQSPPDRNNVKARSACRRARRHSRIGSCQTSLILNRPRRRVPNPPSRGSAHHCSPFTLDYAESVSARSDRPQTIHLVELSSRIGEAKISTPIFKGENKAGSESPDSGVDPRCCRNETAQSDLEMSPILKRFPIFHGLIHSLSD